MKWARLVISGDGLKFRTTIPHFVAANVIAFLDQYHRKDMHQAKPRKKQ